MSKTILFFGNEQLATGVQTGRPVLHALKEAGYNVVEASKNLNKDELAGYGADAGVLIAYGVIIPEEILELFPIINLHPSLLPQYRGSTPIESAILDDATETGVSLMKLAPEMDAGPVYAQEKIELNGNETKQELADKLSDLGCRMIIDNLPAILNGSLQAKEQDHAAATYTKLINKEDGRLEWSKPAVQLEREVRAYAGWPRSYGKLAGTNIVITKASVRDGTGEPGTIYRDGKQLGIYAADGILMIESLIPAGKKEMSTEAFLAGYKI